MPLGRPGLWLPITWWDVLLNRGDVVPVALDNFPHYRFDYLVGRALKFFRTPVYGPPLISDKCLTLSFDGPQ